MDSSFSGNARDKRRSHGTHDVAYATFSNRGEHRLVRRADVGFQLGRHLRELGFERAHEIRIVGCLVEHSAKFGDRVAARVDFGG